MANTYREQWGVSKLFAVVWEERHDGGSPDAKKTLATLHNRDIVDTFPLIGRHHPGIAMRFVATQVQRARPLKLDGQGLGMKTDPMPSRSPA